MVSKIEVFHLDSSKSSVFYIEIFNDMICLKNPQFRAFNKSEGVGKKATAYCIKDLIKPVLCEIIGNSEKEVTHQDFCKLLETLCLEIHYRGIEKQPSHFDYSKITIDSTGFEVAQEHFHKQYKLRPMFCSHAFNWPIAA